MSSKNNYLVCVSINNDEINCINNVPIKFIMDTNYNIYTPNKMVSLNIETHRDIIKSSMMIKSNLIPNYMNTIMSIKTDILPLYNSQLWDYDFKVK